jgi:hypothetical protein
MTRARPPSPHRIHLRPSGRSFAACSTRPQVHVTADPTEVTCGLCRARISTGAERTRPRPPNTRRPAA